MWPFSKGSRKASSALRFTSASSSRNSTPQCARVISPGRGLPPPPVLPTKNVLYVSPGGVVTWNGAPITWAQLDQNLADSQDPAKFADTPELHMQPDPMAPYDVVDRVLAKAKRAKVSKMGFVNNEAYRGEF